MPEPDFNKPSASGSTDPGISNDTFSFGGVLDFLSSAGEAITGGLDTISNTYANFVNFERKIDYIEDQKSGVGTYQPTNTSTAAPAAASGNLPVYLLLGLAVVAGVVILKD